VKKQKPFDYLRCHKTLVADRKRVLSYKKAIDKNVKKGDVILDLGCGTGILSFFAARKNAKKIYAVDISRRMINLAEKVARLNHLSEKIDFKAMDIKKFKPQEKIDVLIHEQIGSFIWDEDMIAKVSRVRDKYLKSQGIIIPQRMKLYLALTNYKSKSEKDTQFWNKRYGIDFTNLRAEAFQESIGGAKLPQQVCLKNKKTFLCKARLIYTIDFRKEHSIPKKLESIFKIRKKSVLTGAFLFFKVHLDNSNYFSTFPQKTMVHWSPIFLPNFSPLKMKRNTLVRFIIFPAKKPFQWKFKFVIN